MRGARSSASSSDGTGLATTSVPYRFESLAASAARSALEGSSDSRHQAQNDFRSANVATSCPRPDSTRLSSRAEAPLG